MYFHYLAGIGIGPVIEKANFQIYLTQIIIVLIQYLCLLLIQSFRPPFINILNKIHEISESGISIFRVK